MTTRGAPTKLTKEKADQILALIRAGNYIAVAASASGVHRDTFYEWLKRGANDKAGIYKDFSDAVIKADAEAEAALVIGVSKGNWQAKMQILERRFNERWGRKDKMDMTSKTEITINEAQLDELTQAIEQAGVLDEVAKKQLALKMLIGISAPNS